jgi:hypothetical protein
MQPLPDFLQHNFNWLFLLCFLWVVVAFGFLYYRHKRTGIVFPQSPPGTIRFEERTASGCSHRTVFTKPGGARNCLQVTVTDTEVWIRSYFPFNVLAQQFDLEHRIPRASIMGVQPKQSAFVRAILLDYRDDRGQTHRLSLAMKKPDDFLSALSSQTQKG